MAMQKLAEEMSAIVSMKDMGQIDSPTAKALRATATAAVLGSTVAVATPAAPPARALCGGSIDLPVFVRVREGVSELVSRRSITVPRGSTRRRRRESCD